MEIGIQYLWKMGTGWRVREKSRTLWEGNWNFGTGSTKICVIDTIRNFKGNIEQNFMLHILFIIGLVYPIARAALCISQGGHRTTLTCKKMHIYTHLPKKKFVLN